jgi:hypothetical protein
VYIGCLVIVVTSVLLLDKRAYFIDTDVFALKIKCCD